MTKFDLIAFDLGNVLTLVDEAKGAARIAALAGCSFDLASEVVFSADRKIPLETGRQSWPAFVNDVRSRLAAPLAEDEFREIFESVLTPNKAIFPLVFQVLASHRVGLCSNTSEPHWRLEANRLPFASQFDPVVVSYQAGVMKPDPRIYELLVERAAVPAHRVLFIDDRAENVAGAVAAGLHAVQFTSVAKLEEDLRRFEVL